MDNQVIYNKLQAQFESAIHSAEDAFGIYTITVSAEQVIPILHFLYADADLQFKFLTDLCGVHYPDNKGKELGVIYHLHNMDLNKRIRVKCFVDITAPNVKTATNLFSAANWMERETYDFYGIIFEGHPNLKRILNMDEMVEFPLRKEFPLEDPFRKDKHDVFFGRTQNNEAIINTKL